MIRTYGNGDQSGLTLIELMVGLVVGSIVMGGAYKLWITHSRESITIEKKIWVRNGMALSSKRIQRSVTLAGIGLKGAANLSKDDAVGSDTLTIYTNSQERESRLLNDIFAGGGLEIQVENPSAFVGAAYVALSSGTGGEIRKILSQEGSTLLLDSVFASDHPASASMAYPAVRERFYTDQIQKQLIREANGSSNTIAREVKNFQVSFRDNHGASTESPEEVYTVLFSFTGVYPARDGALNSIPFSSIAIPRNTL
ncbi:MAG: hypothetical protein JWP91_57 [Fibrobacteres bacterium]|nr:hypothetical protein [Fibrobacterota bacterium]